MKPMIFLATCLYAGIAIAGPPVSGSRPRPLPLPIIVQAPTTVVTVGSLGRYRTVPVPGPTYTIYRNGQLISVPTASKSYVENLP